MYHRKLAVRTTKPKTLQIRIMHGLLTERRTLRVHRRKPRSLWKVVHVAIVEKHLGDRVLLRSVLSCAVIWYTVIIFSRQIHMAIHTGEKGEFLVISNDRNNRD
jgi:hypothetical protein